MPAGPCSPFARARPCSTSLFAPFGSSDDNGEMSSKSLHRRRKWRYGAWRKTEVPYVIFTLSLWYRIFCNARCTVLPLLCRTFYLLT